MFSENSCYVVIGAVIAVVVIILLIVYIMQCADRRRYGYERFSRGPDVVNPNYDTCAEEQPTLLMSPDGVITEPGSKYELEDDTLWTRPHYIIKGKPEYYNVLPPASKTAESNREVWSHNFTDEAIENKITDGYFDMKTQRDFYNLTSLGGSSVL
jgi:hypothetical protein